MDITDQTTPRRVGDITIDNLMRNFDRQCLANSARLLAGDFREGSFIFTAATSGFIHGS
jgi:hypothetical protein